MTATIVNADQVRRRYLAEAVETATPAGRLVMLFDRLARDLRQADAAFAEGDLEAIHRNLVHAQEIVLALRDTLQLDVWDGAARLAALYDHLHAELVAANVAKDRARAAAAGVLLGRIGDAWREAAARNLREQERSDGVG